MKKTEKEWTEVVVKYGWSGILKFLRRNFKKKGLVNSIKCYSQVTKTGMEKFPFGS